VTRPRLKQRDTKGSTVMTPQRIPLAAIPLDARTQIRHALKADLITEYAALMATGVALAPVVLFRDDGGDYHIGDGHLRIAAARQQGLTEILAVVHPGAFLEALWHAMSANREHGHRLNAQDKQHAVVLALTNFPEKMNREIAAQIGCALSLVSKMVARMRVQAIPLNTGSEPDKSDLRGQALVNARKRDQVRELLQQGATSTEIRRTLHAHTSVIAAVREELGQPRQLRPHDMSRVAIAQRKQTVRELSAQGVRSAEIADRLGITLDRVRDIAKDDGITLHHDERDRSRAAVTQRIATIREMAAQGFTSPQIAMRVGLGRPQIIALAKREQIALTADRVVGHRRRHDPNRIIEQMAITAEHLCADVGLIDFTQIDHDRLPEWIRAFSEARTELGTFIRRLAKERQHDFDKEQHDVAIA